MGERQAPPPPLGADGIARLMERLLPLAVFGVALFLRFYRLDVVPTGLLVDEAFNGLDALQILHGARPIFLTDNYGREALFIYLQAVGVALLGRTDLALRVVAAIVGSLTLASSYLVTRRLFGSRIALLACGWLAISLWHVIFSRIGLRAVSLPLFEGLAFYFLSKGMAAVQASLPSRLGAPAGSARRGGLPWFLLAGLALGLSLYTYTSARFAPLVVVALATYLAILHRQLFRAALPKLAVVAAVATAVFLPEGIFFVGHPEAFADRANAVSVLNPEINRGDPGATLAKSTLTTFGMFSVVGDHYWDRNVAGQPIFDPASSALAGLGLVLALRRYRDPAHAFVLIWLAIMLGPGLIAVRDAPNFLRATGLIPAVFVLPALGLGWLWDQWDRRIPLSLRPAPVLLVSLAFLTGSAATARDYFSLWAHAPEVSEVFSSGRWLAIPAALRQTGPAGQAYVASGDDDSPLMRYALEGQADSARVRLFESTRSLILPPELSQTSYVFPGAYLPPTPITQRYFPGQTGQVLAASPDGRPVLLYQLPAIRPAFEPERPLLARFGNVMQVVGHDLPRDARAGESLKITWYWRLLTADTREFAFFSHLLDESGQRWGLVDDRAFAPGYWPADTSGLSTFELKVDRDVPTGPYWVSVGIYDRATLERLPISDSQDRSAGTQALVGPVKVHGRPLPTPAIAHSLAARLGDQIDFVGYDLDRASAAPGEPLTVTLYWSARGRPSRDYTVFVQLLDGADQIRAQGDSPPRAGRYPTALWDAGEVIADRHTLAIAPGTPAGEYRLAIGLYEPETGRRLPVSDQAGQSEGDRLLISGISVR